MSEKQLRNVNDKLIKVLSRIDLANARLTQIVHLLEDLEKKNYEDYKKLKDNK